MATKDKMSKRIDADRQLNDINALLLIGQNHGFSWEAPRWENFAAYSSTNPELFIHLQIDLTKMPLGKLSKKQIRSAYKILTEVQEMFKVS